MKTSKKAIDDAVGKGIIIAEQSNSLYEFLKSHQDNKHSFGLINVLYYMGGILAISSTTILFSLGWVAYQGLGVAIACIICAAAAIYIAKRFEQNGHSVPAGICVTFAVFLAPLAIFGIQHSMGVWPESIQYQEYHRQIQWHWLYMELGTILAGVIAIWKYRYSFLVFPIALTLWYMSMDFAVFMLGHNSNYEIRAMFSMFFGLAVIAIAAYTDHHTDRDKTHSDYAFWLYLFGVMAFWGGLSIQNSDSELAKFGYFAINVAMILIGAVINRKVFVVFGFMGAAGYLGYLSFTVFSDSLLFQAWLIVIGYLIIKLGVYLDKNGDRLSDKARAIITRKQ